MAEGDAQVRPAQDQVRGDDRSGGQADVPGITEHLLQGGRAHQPIHAGRPHRVDEHRGAELLGQREEPIELRRADRPAVDIAADLDAEEFQITHHAPQLRRGEIRILQRDGAEPGDAAACLRHHLGDLIVDVAQQLIGRGGLHPVGKQFRHRRDDLCFDAHLVHVGDALFGVPAAVGDGAIDLAVDHDMLVAGVGVGHRRPMGRRRRSHRARKCRRHNMAVHVDPASAP
jgi:hypothetical protein